MIEPGVLALFIPVLALSIPIVAIISDAYKKSHQGNPGQEKKIEALEKRIQLLEGAVEGKLSDLRSDLSELEVKQQFIQKLLDDK